MLPCFKDFPWTSQPVSSRKMYKNSQESSLISHYLAGPKYSSIHPKLSWTALSQLSIHNPSYYHEILSGRSRSLCWRCRTRLCHSNPAASDHWVKYCCCTFFQRCTIVIDSYLQLYVRVFFATARAQASTCKEESVTREDSLLQFPSGRHHREPQHTSTWSPSPSR